MIDSYIYLYKIGKWVMFRKDFLKMEKKINKRLSRKQKEKSD